MTDHTTQASAERSFAMPGSGVRLAYLDNLRWAMIILVISMHAADTYSPWGNWYFVERQPLSTLTSLTFLAWQTYLQSFFMGLLFFIAGTCVPFSLARKGTFRFVRDRAFRLGLPTLLYMFCIGPITEYYVAQSWTSTLPTSFASEWMKHIRNGQFLQENGPLWFCVALLLFSATYACFRACRPDRPVIAVNPLIFSKVTASKVLAGKVIASKVRPPKTGTIILFILIMASATFVVRLSQPPPFFNMQLGDFPQYILLFAAGIAAVRQTWLANLSREAGTAWALMALSAGFAIWLSLIIFGGALHGQAASYSGGWHWQNAAFCLWESFTGVALCFGLLIFFREKLNQQRRLTKFLSDNAFGVYVFHPPIVIAAARALSGLPWLPLVKFAAVTGLSTGVSFGLTAVLLRRVPLLNRMM